MYLYSIDKASNQKKPKIAAYFIPMAHWIKSYKDLSKVITESPTLNLMWLTLLKDDLADFIQTPKEFSDLFKYVNAESKKYVYDAMDKKILTLIPNGNTLKTVLDNLKWSEPKALLIGCLGIKCQTIIQSGNDLRDILQKIQGDNGKHDARANLIIALSETILTLVPDRQEFKKILEILEVSGEKSFINGRFKSDYCTYLDNFVTEKGYQNGPERLIDALGQEKELITLIGLVIKSRFSSCFDKEMAAINAIIESPHPDLKKVGLIAHMGRLVYKMSFWEIQDQQKERKIFFKMLSALRLDGANTADTIEAFQALTSNKVEVHFSSHNQ
jgi:hypothetical protein